MMLFQLFFKVPLCKRWHQPISTGSLYSIMEVGFGFFCFLKQWCLSATVWHCAPIKNIFLKVQNVPPPFLKKNYPGIGHGRDKLGSRRFLSRVVQQRLMIPASFSQSLHHSQTGCWCLEEKSSLFTSSSKQYSQHCENAGFMKKKHDWWCVAPPGLGLPASNWDRSWDLSGGTGC